jgi:hypothetical protein
VPCFTLAISIIELEPDYDYDIGNGFLVQLALIMVLKV